MRAFSSSEVDIIADHARSKHGTEQTGFACVDPASYGYF